MKYGINCTKDIEHNALIIQGVWSIDNIQFIADESQKKLICSPFTKTTNVAVVAGSTTTTITIMPAAGCTLANDDLITFLIDDFKSTQDVLDEIDKSIGNLGEKPVGGKTIRELLSDISTNALTDSDLSDLQTALVALIGAATDSSSATTLFGKLAALLADTSTLKTDLGTTDGKVDTANTNISAIISNLGAKGVSDLTVRQLLDAIQTNALTITQLNDAKTAITNLIGAASDSSAASTVFGKIAAAKAIIDKLDASLGTDDNNDVHAKLNEILRIIDLFAYGYAITQNNDGTETYTLDLDNSASIDDSTLNIA